MLSKSALAVAAALCAGFVAGQGSTNPTVDIPALPLATKTTWCNAEFNTCNILCNQNANANSCDDTTLNYTCTCASNNSAPGIAFYTQTIPYFLCYEVYTECINNNLQNSTAQAVCSANEAADCAHLNPPNSSVSDSTSSTSSASATSSATKSATAPSSSSTASTSSSKAAAATILALGREYGSGIIAAGFAAALML